jgi:hypothetical protein
LKNKRFDFIDLILVFVLGVAIASIKFNFENGNDAWLITLSVLFTLLFVNFQRILKMFSK